MVVKRGRIKMVATVHSADQLSNWPQFSFNTFLFFWFWFEKASNNVKWSCELHVTCCKTKERKKTHTNKSSMKTRDYTYCFYTYIVTYLHTKAMHFHSTIAFCRTVWGGTWENKKLTILPHLFNLVWLERGEGKKLRIQFDRMKNNNSNEHQRKKNEMRLQLYNTKVKYIGLLIIAKIDEKTKTNNTSYD